MHMAGEQVAREGKASCDTVQRHVFLHHPRTNLSKVSNVSCRILGSSGQIAPRLYEGLMQIRLWKCSTSNLLSRSKILALDHVYIKGMTGRVAIDDPETSFSHQHFLPSGTDIGDHQVQALKAYLLRQRKDLPDLTELATPGHQNERVLRCWKRMS